MAMGHETAELDGCTPGMSVGAEPVEAGIDAVAETDCEGGQIWAPDAGMTTVEYAIGTVVAAAFAAVLYRIVTGDSIVTALADLIRRALNTAL